MQIKVPYMIANVSAVWLQIFLSVAAEQSGRDDRCAAKKLHALTFSISRATGKRRACRNPVVRHLRQPEVAELGPAGNGTGSGTAMEITRWLPVTSRSEKA